MIRTNLATRPFYNERAVHSALAVVALVVAALTVFNVWRIVTLTREQRELTARTSAADANAAQLRAAAVQIRQGLNPQELKAVSSSASEANTIIDRRLFSWTELFNRFEATLPDDARIVSVRPHIEKEGDVQLSMAVIARQYEDVHKFVENLEATGVFSNMLQGEETVNADGLIQVTIHGRYAPSHSAPSPRGAAAPGKP